MPHPRPALPAGASFRAQGEAIVDGVPDDLLGAADGPDLVLGIELDAAESSGG